MLKRLLKLLSGLLSWSAAPRKTPMPERASRVCACGTILSDPSRAACRECAASRVRCGPRPARAARIPGGAELFLPAPGGEMPVRLPAWQAEVLSRALLKPGSATLDVGGDRMLVVSWRLRSAEVRITVWTGDKRGADLSLTAAQAARLGEDVAGCLGIIFTDAPTYPGE